MGKKGKASGEGGTRTPSKKGKMSLEFSISPSICSDSVIQELQKLWRHPGKTSLDNKDFLFLSDPFPCIQLRNLINDEHGGIRNLIEELMRLDYIEKNNDLYKFVQSGDLNNVEGLPSIDAFKKFIYGPMMTWMKKATGIDLVEDHIDLFAAQYQNSDYLLCHDDELEGRRIAFIWYLVPSDWSEDDGGSLDLFDTNEETGEPREIVKSITPLYNSFNFFEVSHLSFHQVSEVLAKDKTRLSITGWFRGQSLAGPQKPPSLVIDRLSPLDIEDKEFFEWINPSFLSPETQGDIQETFEDKSEISLSNFLRPEKFSAVKESLCASDLPWKALGPPNRRSYDVLELENTSELTVRLLKFLSSDAFFLFLSNITGIKLHPLFEGDESEGEEAQENGAQRKKEFSPSCSAELRRWKTGSYTLIRDTDKRELSLDARLCFNVSPGEWDDGVGGFTSYIAKDEEEELMSVSPEENTLLLVYKDEETLKFVKYLNNKFNGSPFYDIEVSYFEE